MTFTAFPNEVYTTFSFFGFILCLIPLPWHLKAWNVGTCLLMFWSGIGCFIFFVNSIVWHGNTFNTAPIWCDICGKIIIGSFTGLPASSLCINRRLYLLQLDPAGNYLATKKSDRIRSLAIDLGISAGLPVLLLSLHYVYQGRRFDIFEDIGCFPAFHNSWGSILLMNAPPVLVGLVSATYSIRAIISIAKKRNQFNALLARRLNITSNLYFRLMCFAGFEALTTTPLGIYFIIVDMTVYPFYPFSWEAAHLEIHHVRQYPAVLWHNFPFASAFELPRWIHVIVAFVFFSIFGFTEGAKSHYHLAVKRFVKLTGIRVGHRIESVGFRTGLSPSRVLPIYPDYHGNRGEQWFPLGAGHHGAQDCSDDQSASQTGPDSPGNSLTSTTNPYLPATAQQESKRTPNINQNFSSFLNLGYNDSTPHLAHSSYTDISGIEEGQPSKPNHLSSSHVSQPFHSFLNFN